MRLKTDDSRHCESRLGTEGLHQVSGSKCLLKSWGWGRGAKEQHIYRCRTRRPKAPEVAFKIQLSCDEVEQTTGKEKGGGWARGGGVSGGARDLESKKISKLLPLVSSFVVKRSCFMCFSWSSLTMLIAETEEYSLQIHLYSHENTRLRDTHIYPSAY